MHEHRDPSLHLISVSESATKKLTASGAKLSVRIAGQSFFTGTEAFKKAAEVAACIASLENIGIPQENIELSSVRTEVESGMLTKSSVAVYELLIDCKSIDMLGLVMSVISAQKNSELTSISWRYPNIEKTTSELLEEAVTRAKQAAQAIAGTLSVPLLGVHEISYDVGGLDTQLPIRQMSRKAKARQKASSEALETLQLSHSSTMHVRVEAEFMIGPFQNASE